MARRRFPARSRLAVVHRAVCRPLPKPWPRAAARPRPTACGSTKARARRQAAQRCRAARAFDTVPATDLRVGNLVLVEAGDIIPGDGEVIEGVASVNESAITGESAPVIREAGGDRSAVTGGTTVLSDWIKVRIIDHARRDLRRPHDRADRRRQAAEDAQRDRAVDPALRADADLPRSPW